MTPFQYARPESLDELLALLQQHGPHARLLAGGTDLMVRLRARRDVPRIVIDLKHVGALRADVTSTRDGISIGARTVMTDIAGSALVQRYFPALVEAALVVGSVQIRNRATLSGNICNASPAADTAPVLLAYEATVNLIGAAGSRSITLEEFFIGPGRTAMMPAEIVQSVDLPLPGPQTGTAFGRLTRRRGVDLAIINLCCHVKASGDVRFALGAVGPRPFLVRDESGILMDDSRTDHERDAVLERLLTAAAPISDLRASDAYRSAMLPIFARRTLNAAIDRMRRSGA